MAFTSIQPYSAQVLQFSIRTPLGITYHDRDAFERVRDMVRFTHHIPSPAKTTED